MNYTIKELKDAQPASETIFSVLIHRHFSPYLSWLLLRLNMTPNGVSVLSLIVGLLAAVYFGLGTYWNLIIGAVLLQFALLLDHCDGEVARVAKLGTKFGGWFDGVIDRIREYTTFLGIGIGTYLISDDITLLILTAAAIGNLLLIGYIRGTAPFLFEEKVSSMKEQPAHINFTKKMHLGSVDTTVFLITFAAIFNVMPLLLWFYAIAGIIIASGMVFMKYTRRDMQKKKEFISKKKARQKK